MDSGYLLPGDTLEDDYDVKKDLLPEEVVGIIDQLICHEVGFSSYFLGPFAYGSRCHGIWDIPCPRRYLQVCISSIYWHRNRRM